MINTKEKYFKLRHDGMFKAVFCNPNNRDLLQRLIEEVLDVSVEILLVLVPELPISNIRVKGKTLDVIVKAEGIIINVEVNSYSDRELHYRNAGYVFNLYSNSVKVGESYNTMQKFIQINLTYESERKIPLKTVYTLKSDDDLEYIDNLKIYEINLQKYKEMCYNEGIETSIIGLLDCNLEELEKIKGDEVVEKAKEEVKRLNEDKEFIEFLTYEEDEEKFINTFINKGIEQENINTAKKMLEETDDLDFISRMTGLSLDQIEDLSRGKND